VQQKMKFELVINLMTTKVPTLTYHFAALHMSVPGTKRPIVQCARMSAVGGERT
jgi:hypothetical protein